MKTALVMTIGLALAASTAQAQYGGVAPAAPMNYGPAPIRKPAQARVAQQPRPAAQVAQRSHDPRLAANQGAQQRRPAYVAQVPQGGGGAYGYSGAQTPLTPIPQGGGGPVAGPVDDGYAGGASCGDGGCGGGCHNPGKLWCECFCYWKSTGDMPQHMPYFPNAHGYYYFHTYNLIHTQQQQEMVSRWGLDPRNPQDNRFFERIYQDHEAQQTQDAIQNEAATIEYPLR